MQLKSLFCKMAFLHIGIIYIKGYLFIFVVLMSANAVLISVSLENKIRSFVRRYLQDT